MIKRNPIYRVDQETGRILETYRDVEEAAKAAKVNPTEMLDAVREGKIVRWFRWKEEDELFCLELSNGRKIVVRQVDVSPADAELLYDRGMNQRPRVVGVKVVFLARDLQDREK